MARVIERSDGFFNRCPELTDKGRAAVRAELSVALWSRAALFTNACIAGAHHCKRLFRVPRFERLVIGVGNLSSLPVELELAKRINCVTLMSLPIREWSR
jgi:hypothetical protein